MVIPIIQDISQAASYIKSGRIVAFPTGTSYGLAADALQGHALQRLRNVKGRSTAKSFTVFLDPSLWDSYLHLTNEEKSFLETHQQQPVTLLVKPKPSLRHLTQAGRIGLRVIDHPLMAKLAKAASVPLTATSANYADKSPCFDPTCIQSHFPQPLPPTDTRHGDIEPAGPTTYDLSLAAILDGGQLPSRQATTILRIEHGRRTIVRQGSLPSSSP